MWIRNPHPADTISVSLLTYSAPMVSLLGPSPTGTETITLDPTFKTSFTLESESESV
jgi:hypothetical protein